MAPAFETNQDQSDSLPSLQSRMEIASTLHPELQAKTQERRGVHLHVRFAVSTPYRTLHHMKNREVSWRRPCRGVAPVNLLAGSTSAIGQRSGAPLVTPAVVSLA